MSWNAFIAIRCNGKLNDTHWEEVKNWGQVDKVWSSMGEWDYWLQLKDDISSTEDLEQFVFNLRSQPWIEATSSRWWKPIPLA